MVNRPIYGFQDITREARSIITKHTHVDEVGAGRYPFDGPRIRNPTRLPSDNPSHMSPVPKMIAAVSTGEVDGRDHPPLQGVVSGVNAGVDYGDCDAFPIERWETVLALPQLVGSDGRICNCHGALDPCITRQMVEGPVGRDGVE